MREEKERPGFPAPLARRLNFLFVQLGVQTLDDGLIGDPIK